MCCTNCGSQMPDNSAFCTNCGAKFQNEQTPANQNMGSSNIQQPYADQNSSGQPYQTQGYPGQPIMNGAKPKSNTPLFIGLGVAAVVAVVIIIFVFKAIFGGGGGAEKVIRNAFKAINTQDAELLMTLAPEDEMEDFEDLDDDEREEAIENIEEMLENINDDMEERYGKDWYDEMTIEETDVDEKKSKTYYTFEVEIKGEDDYDDFEEEIIVIKEDGKFYLDDMPF